MWLLNLLKELDNNEGDTVMLLVGYISDTNLAKNTISHRRSKYIEMRFHYLKELVIEGNLRLGYCRSEHQVTGLLTNGVTIEVVKRLKMAWKTWCTN